MTSKETALDLQAFLSEAIFGHGFLHYGYWPDGPPETPSAVALGEAMQAYFDKLVETIPPGTRTILDVGSGTGATALALTRLGYELECICPSEHLNEMARRKLPETVPVHTLRFEDFDRDKRFDICLFAESFHYIPLDRALRQIPRFAGNGAVIFDYFRRKGASTAQGTRGTHAEFVEEVSRQGVLRIAQDDDLTEAIMPTFQVLDHLKNAHIAPFVQRLRAEFRQSNPLKAFLAERFIGKTLSRLERPSKRTADFPQVFEYRLIRLEPL